MDTQPVNYVALPDDAEDGVVDRSSVYTKLPPISTPDSTVESEEEEPPAYKRVIIVTIAMFMGYAILVSFQRKLKDKYGINDDNSSKSDEYSFAVSFLYIGNLVFRLMHNFFFAPILPRNRVYVALGSMSLSMLILSVFIFILDWTGTMAWIYIAYGLGGMGIGSFESNLLSAITPLGHETKVWAILGFPIGFACVLVGGFMLTAIGVPPAAVYFMVLGMLVVAWCVFTWGLPHIDIENNAQDWGAFLDNMRHWREWLPLIGWHCFSLALNMFNVSLFSGVMLYILNGKKVPLFGADSDAQLPHDWFFVLYNLFTLAGDSISRRVMYNTKPRHPAWYLILSFAGAALCLSKLAILAPIGIFMVFFANGSIYATTTRYIDTHVLKEFNLVALSFWLFIGDFGSVTGSNLLPYIKKWVCNHHKHHYICCAKPYHCN